MEALREAFESAGFADVRTVLSSGNVVFSSRVSPAGALERKAEAAMRARLGSAFPTIVRELEALRRMIAWDPYAGFRLAPGSKRVVTFLRARQRSRPTLPIERDGARILRIEDREVFTSYVPGPRGPAFMALIEETFGKDVTTRSWDTVRKVAR